MANIEIVYTFEDRRGGKFTYPILIDRMTGCLVSETQLVQPGWTALQNCQCRVCPLERERYPHCPIAVNIHGLVEYFKDFFSTDQMRITVVTEERTYFREAPAQKGLASILGVVMATSGCPVMDFLRPMAKYHLPFASSEETIIRSTSMYLLAQYFVSKRGGKPDISLEKLNLAYENVQLVNEGMCDRIATVVHKRDATSNAVVILHTFSQLLGMAIDAKLDSLEPLFEDFHIAGDCGK